MTSYPLCVLLLFASVFCNCRSLKIGILMPIKAPYPGFPSIETSGGAISLAMEEVQRRYTKNISVVWQDTGCDEGLSIIAAYDLGKDLNVDAIIGPACAKCMDLVSKLMSVLKPTTPTLTWLPRPKSKSHPNDTAISTYTSFNDITDALVITFKHYSWKKLAIIASKMELCVPLIETVNDVFPNKDLNILRLLYLDGYTAQDLRNALTEARDHARIILVCLQSEFLASLLAQADDIGMTSQEFVFIYCRLGVSPTTGLIEETKSWDSEKRKRALTSLIQIGSKPVNETVYQKFVNDTHTKTFSGAPICCNKTDEFAAFLYDTILLAADMINSTVNVSVNGAYDYSHMQGSFHSMFGATTVTPEGIISHTITLTHYQNGGFEVVGHVNGSYKVVRSLFWPGGKVPPDSPRCGWRGEECSDDVGNKNSVIIGSCVSIVVVLVISGIVFLCYRKSRFEKELMSMIWKVNNNDIKMRRPRLNTQNSLSDRDSNANPRKKKLVRMDTRGTLGLGSTSSIDKTVLFAPVGSYKGSIVAVKDIKRRSIQLNAETLRDLNALRQLQHENLNPFIGVSLDPGNSYILMKYCAKGSLHDVLENEDIKLDTIFKMSFILDLSRGLECLHKSVLKSHGNLKSTNCVIDSRWVLKLTDYGAVAIPTEEDTASSASDAVTEADQYSKLLWTAPELLRMHRKPPKGTQKGDVYSFAIIMQEILLRCPPYYFNGSSSNQVIINRVKNYEDPPYRPRVMEDETESPEKLVALMRCCWQEIPDARPDMHTVLKTLIDINGRRKTNIMDNMIMMLESYSNNLEELVANRTEELAREKQKTDTLLYQMLPPLVAEQLKRGEHVVPETFSEASIFFSDIVGFTSLSGSSTALQVIDLLNDLYTTFDEIIGMHDVYKVETIGDAYMVSSGIPRRNGRKHAGEIANMALDLLSAVTNFQIRHMTGAKLQLRIGLHTGPCAAGVVGLTMPRYCLFGDTINMASRMESTGKDARSLPYDISDECLLLAVVAFYWDAWYPVRVNINGLDLTLHIHVSTDFVEVVKELNWGFQLMERGVIEVKGKGLQKTYWLIGKEGYTATLPEEVQRLKEKYAASEESGRPSSPTDTNISNGSQQESTSMYGSAFRRASNAIIFLRQLSAQSSPSGSRLTVRDIEDDRENDAGVNDRLNIPPNKESNKNLKLPQITLPWKSSSDDNESSSSSTIGKKKKKKSKKKHKEKASNLQVPTIEITR